MKRRTEHLVLKRDGRTEFLRATKLARSIHLALHSVGVDEDWRAIEIASVALQALRRKRGEADGGEPVLLTTSELSDAVQHLLVVTGQPAAAVAYGAVAAERTRRRRSVAEYGRLLALGSAKSEVAEDPWRHRRIGLE
ncbi:MAG TPA: ATP cone domain-containing protein [Planctomycetota bacterium]|nr:ATP cone domain-containing protein [Planctomycetota bacterium]